MSCANHHALPDGARLYYREEGEGETVLLVHGGTGTGDYDWEYVRPSLAQRYHLIIPDLRGHGRSSDPHWQLSLDTMAQDMVSLMGALGIRPRAIVGFSMGGTAILRRLCQEPGMTDAFVGIGLSRAGDPSRVEGFINGPWPRELIALEHEHGEDADHWRDLRKRMATSWGYDLAISDEDLARIKIPALVVCGDRDAVDPVESSLALARALPRGEFMVLPACSHFAIRDRPAEFLVALEGFLARHLGSRPAPSGAATASGQGVR